MPFTLSHAAVAPLWAKTGHRTPAASLALACGSVAPDIVRHGFPARFQTPSHTVIAALTTDTLVALFLFAASVLLLGPALVFVSPNTLRPLAELFKPVVAWATAWIVVIASIVGCLLHLLVDLPSHAPSEWMTSGWLTTDSINASWLRNVPFSIGGDPYPWYYINRLLLSAAGLIFLALAAIDKVRSSRVANLDSTTRTGPDRSTARRAAQAGILIAGTYGAITTRFYTDSVFERTIIDVTVDVVIGTTAGSLLMLLITGCGLRLQQRLTARSSPS